MPHMEKRSVPFGEAQQAIHAVQVGSSALATALGNEPRAKAVVRGVDNMIGKQWHWNDWPTWSAAMSKFWATDLIYDYAMPNATYHGLQDWFNGEHTKWNVAFPDVKFAAARDVGFIFAGNEQNASLITYAHAHFEKDFYGIPAPPQHPVIVITDLDFYILNNEGKIHWNACMGDSYGIMAQAGYQLLPKPSLPEGKLFPPRTMSGLPAPDSKFVHLARTVRSRQVYERSLANDWIDGHSHFDDWSDDLAFYGPWGIGMAKGKQQLKDFFFAPLWSAFAERSFTPDVVVCEGPICSAHGHLQSVHMGTWLGQPASDPPVKVALRIALFLNIDDHDKILDAYCVIDIPQAMQQMGRDLFQEAQLIAQA